MASVFLKQPLPRGEDLPYDDGIPLESHWHRSVMNLLIDILSAYWKDRRDCYINGNMFIYFDPDQVKTRNFRGPDFFVVKGVKNNHLRKSWVVWEEEGLTPDYVIELASESTVKFDVTGKKAIYEKILKTPEYVVYDPNTRKLQGWRLKEGRYQAVRLDKRGWLWSEQLELWLGMADYALVPGIDPVNVLRFFDPQGKLLPTPAEAEAQRADAETQRADAETQRADAETKARQAAEAEIARLKALLAQKQ
jgi:Uma2 family endonuclease